MLTFRQERDAILGLLRFDKKNNRGRVLFSLLERIGRACTDQEVSQEMLEACLDYYMD